MAQNLRLICDSCAFADGGKGVRFNFKCEGDSVPVFAICHRGKVYAYLNHCAHVGLELDWIEGEFFNDLGLYLICYMHSTTYAPDTGLGRTVQRRKPGAACRGGKRRQGLFVNERGLKHGG